MIQAGLGSEEILQKKKKVSSEGEEERYFSKDFLNSHSLGLFLTSDYN